MGIHLNKLESCSATLSDWLLFPDVQTACAAEDCDAATGAGGNIPGKSCILIHY